MSTEKHNPGRGEEIGDLSYVFGAISPEEESAFERTVVHRGDSGSDPLLADLEESLQALAVLAEEAARNMPAPRHGLKHNVIKAAVQLEGGESGGELDAAALEKSVVRASGGSWQDVGVPGITLKVLTHHSEQGRNTALVRIAAGAHYPHHRHVGHEECLVLEGDLHVNDLTLHAGDYIFTPDGIEHVRTYSENGCLLLLSTRLEDEILS